MVEQKQKLRINCQIKNDLSTTAPGICYSSLQYKFGGYCRWGIRDASTYRELFEFSIILNFFKLFKLSQSNGAHISLLDCEYIEYRICKLRL